MRFVALLVFCVEFFQSTQAADPLGAPPSESQTDVVSNDYLPLTRVVNSGYADACDVTRSLSIRQLHNLIPHNFNFLIKDREGNSLLHCAARFGDDARLNFFLVQGLPVDGANNIGETALHIAAKRNSAELIDILLHHNADVNAETLYDENAPNVATEQTPLHYACRQGNVEAVKILLGAEAFNTVMDSRPYYPIEYAVEFGHLDVVRAFNDAGALSWQQYSGIPIEAARFGHLHILQYMVSLDRFPVNSQYTVSCTAASAGQVEVLRWLYANFDPEPTFNDIYFSPLYAACKDGQVDAMRWLLTHGGADVTSTNNADKESCVHAAAESGALESMQLLISLGADLSVQNPQGNSVIHYAASGPNPEMVRLVLEQSTDAAESVNIQTDLNEGPLHFAAKNNRLDNAILLIEAGATIDALDNQDFTPLCIAAKDNFPDMIQLLAERGANIEHKILMGLRPVHLAAFHASTLSLIALLRVGAEIDSRSDLGGTPLLHGMSAHADIADIAVLLHHFGADINARFTFDGETSAAVIASEAEHDYNHLEALRVLRDLGADFDQVFEGMTIWERLAARGIDLPEEVETPQDYWQRFLQKYQLDDFQLN